MASQGSGKGAGSTFHGRIVVESVLGLDVVESPLRSYLSCTVSGLGQVSESRSFAAAPFVPFNHSHVVTPSFSDVSTLGDITSFFSEDVVSVVINQRIPTSKVGGSELVPLAVGSFSSREVLLSASGGSRNLTIPLELTLPSMKVSSPMARLVLSATMFESEGPRNKSRPAKVNEVPVEQESPTEALPSPRLDAAPVSPSRSPRPQVYNAGRYELKRGDSARTVDSYAFTDSLVDEDSPHFRDSPMSDRRGSGVHGSPLRPRSSGATIRKPTDRNSTAVEGHVDRIRASLSPKQAPTPKEASPPPLSPSEHISPNSVPPTQSKYHHSCTRPPRSRGRLPYNPPSSMTMAQREEAHELIGLMDDYVGIPRSNNVDTAKPKKGGVWGDFERDESRDAHDGVKPQRLDNVPLPIKSLHRIDLPVLPKERYNSLVLQNKLARLTAREHYSDRLTYEAVVSDTWSRYRNSGSAQRDMFTSLMRHVEENYYRVNAQKEYTAMTTNASVHRMDTGVSWKSPVWRDAPYKTYADYLQNKRNRSFSNTTNGLTWTA